jgi:hypothetical protein
VHSAAAAEVSAAAAAEVSAAATAEVSAATTTEMATSPTTTEMATSPTPETASFRGQGTREGHHRGQHDCANCNSVFFHRYLPRVM